MGVRRQVLSRASILKSIGFSSYRAYLNSELWATIRGRVLSASPNCRMCGGEARCVHHRSYDRDTLRGERDSSLTPLCLRCHEKIEFKGDGGKRRTSNANHYLKQFSEPSDAPAPIPETSPPGVVCFGVHRGKPWSETPDSWLEWCRQNLRSPDVLALVKREMAARGFARSAGKSSPRTESPQVHLVTPISDPSGDAPWEGEDDPAIAAMRQRLSMIRPPE